MPRWSWLDVLAMAVQDRGCWTLAAVLVSWVTIAGAVLMRVAS